MRSQKFEVAILSKIAHAKILKIINQYGGTKNLSKELGISDYTLRSWLYLRSMPNNRKRRGKPHIRSAIIRLCKICEATPEELFPGFIRERLNGKSIQFTTIKTTSLSLIRDNKKSITYERDYFKTACNGELKDKLFELLNTLPEMEKTVIRLRYGLNGQLPLTLRDAGKFLNISGERVRQIEAKALRRLQDPKRANQLVAYVEADLDYRENNP